MTQRVSLSILLCTLAALTAQAQWSKQDSLRLQQLLNGEEELIINKEAVKINSFLTLNRLRMPSKEVR